MGYIAAVAVGDDGHHYSYGLGVEREEAERQYEDYCGNTYGMSVVAVDDETAREIIDTMGSVPLVVEDGRATTKARA